MGDSASIDNTAIPDGHHPPSSTAIKGFTTSENDEAYNTCGFQSRFGCLGFRPACLQFLGGARWFLFFICMGTFCQSMVVNGLIGVTIPTTERRFGLPSSKTAWLISSYEISGAPALLIIGYFGLTLRRPIWIGGGLILLGIGSVIYLIPHFAAPPYRFADSGDSNNLCVEKNASLMLNDGYGVVIYCNSVFSRLLSQINRK